MPAKPLPSIDEIRNKLSYDAETGLLHRLPCGSLVSSKKNGYIRFRFMNQMVMAHRIAWALHHGEAPPPEMQIDHINGIRHDNRIANLRLVLMPQNMRNKTKYRNNTHGYPGIIYEDKARRKRMWRAQIQVDGRQIKIGSYKCKTAAIFARKAAEKKHGFSELAGDKKWQLCTK